MAGGGIGGVGFFAVVRGGGRGTLFCFCKRLSTAPIMPPAQRKVTCLSIWMTLAPASAAESAAALPDVPAPTTMTSAVKVPAMSFSGMGSWGTTNFLRSVGEVMAGGSFQMMRPYSNTSAYEHAIGTRL